MKKRGIMRDKKKKDAVYSCSSLLRGMDSKSHDYIAKKTANITKTFFRDYYSIRFSPTFGDITKIVTEDESLPENIKKDIKQLLENISDAYYGNQKISKKNLKDCLRKFIRIVNFVIKKETTKKKKPPKKKGIISKTKELVEDVKLTGYDKKTKPVIATIFSAYESIEKDDIKSAEKNYEKATARYSVLPVNLKKSVYFRLKKLEKDIQEKYTILKCVELEKDVDLGQRQLRKKRFEAAERWYKKAQIVYEELPKDRKKKFFYMMKEFYDDIKTKESRNSIEQIRIILDEVIDMKKKYNYNEIKKKYDSALRNFKKLNNKEKAKMFDSMKDIKKRNDKVYIMATAEKIAGNCQKYQSTGRFNENTAIKSYDSIKETYDNLQDSDKKEEFDIIKNVHLTLIETITEIKIKRFMNSIKRRRKSVKGDDKLFMEYNSIYELYNQIPENRKKRFYQAIHSIYNKLSLS